MFTAINENKKSFLLITLLSLACHAVAVIQCNLRISSFYYAEHWYPQFVFSVLLSAVLAAILPFINKVYIGVFFLACRLLLFVLIGFPLDDYVGIRFTLMTSLLLDLAIFLKFPENVFLGGVFITISLIFSNLSITIWKGKEIFGLNLHDNISFSIYSVVILVVSTYLNKYRYLFIHQKKNSERLDQAVEQISKANVGFQDYAKIVESQALTSERQRVSREIHDSVGYALTNLTMMMEAAMDMEKKDPMKLRELIWKAKNQAEEALQETHRALRTLRSIETRREKGIPAIHTLINNFEKATNVAVEVEYCNLPQSLGERYDDIMYRTIQEGLTNAFRHGKADTVSIIFWRDDSQIKLWIRDNGKGSEIIQKGIGLSGMQERMEFIGGKISAKNTYPGFELEVLFPWKRLEDGENYEFRTTNIS